MSGWTTRQIRRTDPSGNTPGGPVDYAPKPRCRCGCPFAVHALPTVKGRPRGECSRSGCNCTTYRPEETPDAA